MTVKNRTYQLIWQAGYSERTEADSLVIGKANPKYKNRKLFYNSGLNNTKNIPNDKDFLQNLLNVGNNTDISIEFNSGLCFAQEYTPQITNKIASYSTLAGNSVVAFGAGIRKIGMKLTIIKAGKYWIPYSSALEAFAIMSGSPSRYLGSLFLHSFDATSLAQVRRYKVVVESLTPVYRAERNTTIDFDMNMLVTYDYSSDRFGRWGKLV